MLSNFQPKNLKQTTKVAMGWLFLICVKIINIYNDIDKYTDMWHFAVLPWAIAVNHWYMKVCDEQVTVARICLLWGFMLKSFTEWNSPKTFPNKSDLSITIYTYNFLKPKVSTWLRADFATWTCKLHRQKTVQAAQK